MELIANWQCDNQVFYMCCAMAIELICRPILSSIKKETAVFKSAQLRSSHSMSLQQVMLPSQHF